MPQLRLFALLLFCLTSVTAQPQVRMVQGTVRDARTNEKLPFVSIAANKGETGTTTNLEGRYQLRHNRPITSLRFSYVGYNPQVVNVDSASTFNVYLQPSAAQLQEVVVFSTGENPAHRIIRLANQNRERHQPENLNAYTYRTYNKFILTATNLQEGEMSDTLQLAQQDSSYIRIRNLLSKQHLFLMESITDYAYLRPSKSKETILATRVSGLQQPSFGIVAAEARDFSVYDDMPVFFGKRYLSPLSTGSTRKYDFVLQETTVQGQDTLFIISFKPQEGRNFEGLNGLLYINSDGWAVQNVLAESAADDERNIKLQQRFEQVGPQQQWFPTELDVEIRVPQVSMRGHQPYAHLRTYITNINLNPNLHRSDFGVVALQQKADAARQPDTFWQQYRPDSLSKLERYTYHQLDSVGKAENIEKTIRIAEYLMAKQIPFGVVSLDLNRLLRVSSFEGLRLGAGFHTNDRLSERFSVGGYGGYGFGDKEFKYGADARFVFHEPSQLQLKAEFFEDIIEAGGRRLPFKQRSLLRDFRSALLPEVDYTTHKSLALSGRPFLYVQAQAMLRQEQRRPTLDFASLDNTAFNLTEAVISMRYAYGEKYMQQFNQLIAMPTEYPVLWLQYTRSLDGVWNGDYSYDKVDARLETTFRHRTLGESSFTFAGGWLQGNAPLTSLFNGYGSYNPDYMVYAGEGFETMQPYEFFSDRYAALFFKQNFGKRFLNTRFFAPDIALVTNAGIGTLSDPLEFLEEVPIQSMRKGFFESGLLLNNVISSPFSGVGIGAFYRYGPYSFDNFKDNLKIKMTISLAF
ncbi:DUF5686 and carboxypeptidase-like regulatory domain-containing protein [Pontibacter harenae]|uniref:DUF5686 and carboxypeptidase-like regulatory domain-containing protein n=1 Tax=Pontibacter harenae TaxID=2894083 RepID=UPI001E4E2E98|nr:DUF5686 and carboxypeptidase-like regulatory domain-containing protein [Pontibacter harenae]MCC9168797.1 DUF5686 and carboxypeptidase regulatory-like domain-containing protein [Pontibacter harenae]